MTVYTLSGVARWEEEVKRSRFLAIAAAVRQPEEALAFFEAHRVPEATHNCWAFQIGDTYRFNDDGEPGGTAGRPILQAIQGQQCDQVAVLVIRWFGGVKLGTGGLVRAYGGCAAQCLRQAQKQPIIETVDIVCHCPFADLDRIKARLMDQAAQIVGEEFDASGVTWQLKVAREGHEAFMDRFIDQTSGQGRINLLQSGD